MTDRKPPNAPQNCRTILVKLPGAGPETCEWCGYCRETNIRRWHCTEPHFGLAVLEKGRETPRRAVCLGAEQRATELLEVFTLMAEAREDTDACRHMARNLLAHADRLEVGSRGN